MTNEISKNAQQLSQAVEVGDRRRAASSLRDAGFSGRISLEKRGTLGRAAESPLQGHELDALHGALEDDDRTVRWDAIISAGDLGDASTVRVLMKRCQDPDSELRLAAIDSLGDIGGAESISTLTGLASNRDEDAEVRLAALIELEELAAKRITSGPDRWFDPPTDPADDEVEAAPGKVDLVKALHSLESDSTADELLRLKAADVRGYVESGEG